MRTDGRTPEAEQPRTVASGCHGALHITLPCSDMLHVGQDSKIDPCVLYCAGRSTRRVTQIALHGCNPLNPGVVCAFGSTAVVVCFSATPDMLLLTSLTVATALFIMIDGGAAHGGLTTPRPRNSFNQPLNPAQPGKFGGETNYYDDGCVPGCDSCLHHGATGSYPSGEHGCQLLPGGCFIGEASEINVWAAPSNVRCTVGGRPVGRGLDNVTVPGSNTLPDHARTWSRNATAVNTNPLLPDWGMFQPWRAPGAWLATGRSVVF